MMPPRDQLADQFRRRVEQFVLVRTDVGNFGVPSQSGVKATRDRKTAPRIRGFRKNVHYFLTPWQYLDIDAAAKGTRPQ